MNETLEFVCPECESREEPRASKLMRRCQSCGHEWSKDQDYVYYVVLKRFTSPQEYKSYVSGASQRLHVITIYAIGVAIAFTFGFWVLWWLR